MNPYNHSPIDRPLEMPLQFRDSTGLWHLFGFDWFMRHSERVNLETANRSIELAYARERGEAA